MSAPAHALALVLASTVPIGCSHAGAANNQDSELPERIAPESASTV